MKKISALLLALIMALSCVAIASADDPIELDVIICEYGNNTREWFLGSGMDGTNFVAKFEEANPDVKLNLQVISWSDVHKEVSTPVFNSYVDKESPKALWDKSFGDFQLFHEIRKSA